MAEAKGLVLETDIVAQEFNLEEILGVDLSKDEALAAEIGNDIVDYITKRSAAGRGIGGSKLRSPYSKEYLNSEEAKIYGKKPAPINMRLSGDMISSMDVIDFDGTTLVVGIEGEEAAKAHGHMTGKNGTVPNMKREFFGLTSSELKKITDNYSDRISALESPSPTIGDLLSEKDNASINDFFNNIGDIFKLKELK